MTNNETSILILKPTSYFLSFLAKQLPTIELPDIKTIQSDGTAYSIGVCNDDDSVLEELERLYPLMFKHEAQRLVEEELANRISGSFLDFLCCFKFEFHSHIMLLESCLDNAHQVLCVKPRSVVLKWNNKVPDTNKELTLLLEDIELSHCSDNATVLVKNFDELTEVNSFIKKYYQPIFNAEMVRMSEDSVKWPILDSAYNFSRYFAVEMHSQLVHFH